MNTLIAIGAGIAVLGGLGAGIGIGIDRLAILMTGQPTIQEVLLFPTMRPE